MQAQPVIASPLEVLATFLPIEMRLIRRTGITLWTLCFWHGDLADFVDDRRLHEIAYDPRDITVVYVRGKDGHFRTVPCVTPDTKRMSLTEWRGICANKRAGIRDPRDAALRDKGLDMADRQVTASKKATREARRIAKEEERQRGVDLIRKTSPKPTTPPKKAAEVNPTKPPSDLAVEILD